MTKKTNTSLIATVLVAAGVLAAPLLYAGYGATGAGAFKGGTVPDATTFSSLVTANGGIAVNGQATVKSSSSVSIFSGNGGGGSQTLIGSETVIDGTSANDGAYSVWANGDDRIFHRAAIHEFYGSYDDSNPRLLRISRENGAGFSEICLPDADGTCNGDDPTVEFNASYVQLFTAAMSLQLHNTTGLALGGTGITISSALATELNCNGDCNSADQLEAPTFESTVATGTAPLTVASTTKVTNLNADTLDGVDSAAFVTAGLGQETDYVLSDVISTSGQTFVDVTGVSFTLAANDVYSLECFGRVASEVTTSATQFGIQITSGDTVAGVCQAEGASVGYWGFLQFSTSNDDRYCAFTTTPTTPGAPMALFATITANSGGSTVKLRLRNEIADANDVIVKQGTRCTMTKIVNN